MPSVTDGFSDKFTEPGRDMNMFDSPVQLSRSSSLDWNLAQDVEIQVVILRSQSKNRLKPIDRTRDDDRTDAGLVARGGKEVQGTNEFLLGSRGGCLDPWRSGQKPR